MIGVRSLVSELGCENSKRGKKKKIRGTRLVVVMPKEFTHLAPEDGLLSWRDLSFNKEQTKDHKTLNSILQVT